MFYIFMVMSLKLKYFLLVFALLTFSFSLRADHYYGASIAYKALGGFAYEFTVITYTDGDNKFSDEVALRIYCGDGKSLLLPRTNGPLVDQVPNGVIIDTDAKIKKNIYKGQYTYSNEGNFKAYISEAYRHGSIANVNIGNSAVKKLYISAIIPVYTDASICVNNSAEYQLDPLFYAYEGVEYSTNFGLYDSDGDSLAFEITDCKGANGLSLENYFIPSSVSVDPHTGTLTWTNPIKGMYTYSVMVSEFRKEKKIGVSAVDFLIFVSTGFSETPAFSVDPQFSINSDGTYAVSINPTEVLKYSSSISLTGSHTISYSAWNNTGAIVSSNPMLAASSVTDTIQWTTLLSQGRTAPYIFVHRFSITEGGKKLQKDFAVLVYVVGNQLVTCTVPDIGTIEKVPPELAYYTVSPTVFTDGVYINTGSSPDILKVFIYDIQGKEMDAFSNFTQETVYLDLSHYAAAVYILVLWKGNDPHKLVTHIVKL